MDADIVVIRLDLRDAECRVCGVRLPAPHHGVPMYEGLVPPNDWGGEWAGFDVCERCYHTQSRIAERVTADELLELSRRAL